MSLTRTGVWAANVWASTVWADGVWFETAATQTQYSGGYPASGDRKQARTFVDYGTHLERGRAERAEEIVSTLATKQAEDRTQSERSRQLALELELRAAGIEWQAQYLERMNELRERMIEARIAQSARNEADSIALLLIAASV